MCVREREGEREGGGGKEELEGEKGTIGFFSQTFKQFCPCMYICM